jgi:tRNA(Glu) U13 pseudouridine synthase TruD
MIPTGPGQVVARPARKLRAGSLRGGRRALRIRPGDATLESVSDGLRLRFMLPPGSYATVLVDDLLDPESPALA